MVMLSRTLVLTGLSGAGKSTAGLVLADALQCLFVDLDQQIVVRAGKSIETIFTTVGEEAFRRLEADLLSEYLAETPLVLAVGAGALVDAACARLALARGTVVWLKVRPETAAARCARSEVRPLLQGDVTRRLTELLTQREAGYGAAHYAVATDDLSPEEVAQAVLVAVGAEPTLGGAQQ